MTADTITRLLVGRCLEYPDSRLYGDLPQLRAALDGAGPEAAALIGGFLDHVAATEPLELCAHYTATFDTRNRRCLYLTWWADGDTRRRGFSLVRLKQTYRNHGLEYADEELPDFLPVALDFAARHPDAGTALLEEHRVGLELLRIAVTAAGTPYTAVLEALCTTLPGPSPRTKEEAKAMARNGPPQELVGIGSPPAPFGPGTDLPWPAVAGAGTDPPWPAVTGPVVGPPGPAVTGPVIGPPRPAVAGTPAVSASARTERPSV